MKNIIAILCSFLLFSCGDNSKPDVVADLVLTNGNVITVEKGQPKAQAIAIVGEKIIGVGSSAEMASFIGENTEVIDLEGKTAIPSFIEGHGHYIRFGASMLELDFRYTKNFDEIVSLVSDAVATTPKGEWIIGRAWHQDKWDSAPTPNVDGLPKHNQLSDISPDHPVMLIHASNHGIFVNKYAMDLVDINADTVPPQGGEIVRDENGVAIGMMREAAQDVFRVSYADHQAKRSPEEIEQGERRKITIAGEELLRHGITSFQDLGSNFVDIDILRVMADEGALPVRLYMALHEQAVDMEDKLADYKMIGYGGGFLTVRTIGEKVLDGALGTHGAWLHEPYTDMPNSNGFNVVPIEEIEYSARLAMKHDFQLAIQGIGDRATTELLNIYGAEMAKNPDKKDLRWRIEHAQVIHPDDVQRFVDLKVIPSVQGIFACSDGPWVEDRLGKDRTLERGYIFNTLYEAGLNPTNGTDPPVDEVSPIASFHCSVTRELPDGTIFKANETYSRDVALYSYTMGNAYSAFEENIKGSIKVGKLADIAILSQDIVEVPDDEIMNTEVEMTILGGKVVYKK